MSAETELYDTLKADSAVLAIVGPTSDVARIFPDVIPLDTEIPAIAFARADTEFINTVHGTAPLGSTATLEVTCVDTTREKADALAVAVINASAAAGFSPVSRAAAVELESDLWATILNLIFNE